MVRPSYSSLRIGSNHELQKAGNPPKKTMLSTDFLLNRLFTLSMHKMEVCHQHHRRWRRWRRRRQHSARHNPHKPPVCLQECKTHTEKACCHYGKSDSSLPEQIKKSPRNSVFVKELSEGKRKEREKKSPRKHPQVNLDIILGKGHLTIRKWYCIMAGQKC